MKRLGAKISVVLIAGAAILWVPAASAQEPAEVTQADATEAAGAIVNFCKILVERIDGIIADDWATQDLKDLASTWHDLKCHELFGVDERVRLRVR